MSRALLVPLLVTLGMLGSPPPAEPYLKLGVRVGDRVMNVRWNRPVTYFISERSAPGVGPLELRDAVGRAFATWQSVTMAALQSQLAGFTVATPEPGDGRTTLGFLDRPGMERVLGATSLLLDRTTGEILEADVFFNARFTWSTAPLGDPGRVDLESVALHEVGHLLGLGHSAIGETEMIAGGRRVLASGAVMFPIALSPGAVADRQLQADDRAGITDLYPGSGAGAGGISGRVTKNGVGVFGAHVVAFHLESGALVGGFALNAQGDYVIGALPRGAYLLRVEPIDDAEPDSFFSGPVDADFRVSFAPTIVTVPSGGRADAVELQVRPK